MYIIISLMSHVTIALCHTVVSWTCTLFFKVYYIPLIPLDQSAACVSILLASYPLQMLGGNLHTLDWMQNSPSLPDWPAMGSDNAFQPVAHLNDQYSVSTL